MDEQISDNAPRFTFKLRDHPLRSALSSEMHGRKLPPVRAPARLMQVIVAVADGELDHERVLLRGLLGVDDAVGAKARYVRTRLGDAHLIWERHTEFSSYMLIREGAFGEPFAHGCFDVLPQDWLSSLPGETVRATQLAYSAKELPEVVASAFVQEDLVHCAIMDGRARLWSDFRLNHDGFGRLLIVNRQMSPVEAAIAIQRVQELGNYRNLALLGLPVAQDLSARLTALERRLAVTTEEIAGEALSDDQLLRSLTDLSADVARIAATTHYRMSASRAYAEMAEDRLRGLRIARIEGHQSLDDFTERRLLPAVRTCVSFSSRLDVLAQRAAWTSSLLRTRVDTELSTQNRNFLRSMNHRTALQLRMQQTVESLSVVAISYYTIGLLGHLLDGLTIGPPLNSQGVLAALVPAVVLSVWLALRLVHRRLGRAIADPGRRTGQIVLTDLP